MKINIFWFRRDLRLEDNTALKAALNLDMPVLPVFIFDTEITGDLPPDDARVNFIYESLSNLNNELLKHGSSVLILKAAPVSAWEKLLSEFDINAVFTNRDYEPYAIGRDSLIEGLLKRKGTGFYLFSDQVVFEGTEILKPDNKPYTVFTPYRNRWIQRIIENQQSLKPGGESQAGYFSCNFPFPSLQDLGFRKSQVRVRPFDLSVIPEYHKYRDIPAADRTTYLSPHLRFGTVSIRDLVNIALRENLTFLNELIWREFFMQILSHFPHAVTENFKPVYDDIQWRNDEREFERWCSGETGYPIVDAGMRQLNNTGYMHNRVRMVTAGFLCKHLLIDWRWGEAYFAEKLLDYELASNNGNWQWASGTGCDAAPYFRIFNPEIQQKKFDPANEYIRKWVDDFGKPGYPAKMVDHDFARQRALAAYRAGIKTAIKKT